MQFLTQALILSAFVSAEVTVAVSAADFKEQLESFTDDNQAQFEAEVEMYCTVAEEPEARNIADAFLVLAKLKLVESNADATTKLASSLEKLQVCQDNLVNLYAEDITAESLETVKESLLKLEDDDLKAKVIEKSLDWLKAEAEKTSGQSEHFTTLLDKYTKKEVTEADLEFEMFQGLEKFQEREAALNVLDAIYIEGTELSRPNTDLVKGLVSIEQFKGIMEATIEPAYQKKIDDSVTADITKEAINNFLTILKDVHVNLIKSDSDEKSYIVEHRKLVEEADVGTYFLKEVLLASKGDNVSQDEVKDFVNRAADLNFEKRRDDTLYNLYQDSVNKGEDSDSDELKKQKEDAFYTPSLWETLSEAQFDLMKEGLDSESHTKQVETHGESIINIPVHFNFADEPEDQTSSSTGTVDKEQAYIFFDNVMDDIRNNTCVNFFKINDEQAESLVTSEDQFIRLTKAKTTERGCDEIVGKKPVDVSLPTIQPFSELCLKGNEEGKPSGIAHYFMHHLGFDNEHQRPDADKFVSHPSDDKLPMLKGRPGQNMKMEESDSASFLTGTYDRESVMHWASKWTASNDGEDILHMRSGSNTVFSTQDYQKISNLYCGGAQVNLQDDTPDCKYMVTNSNKDDFDVKDNCLQQEDDDAKLMGLADIYFENSTDDEESYEISAKVVYKTEILSGDRLLEGWVEEDYEITNAEREELTNDKCGNAKIYLLSESEKKQFCSLEGDAEETEISIQSDCGKPMKLQYVLKDGKNVDTEFIPNLSVKDIVYTKCNAEHTASLLEKASSSIIGLSVLLLTI